MTEEERDVSIGEGGDGCRRDRKWGPKQGQVAALLFDQKPARRLGESLNLGQGLVAFLFDALLPRHENRLDLRRKCVRSLWPALPGCCQFLHVNRHVARPLSLPPGITTCEEKEKWLTRDPMDGRQETNCQNVLGFCLWFFFTGKSRQIHAYYPIP